jgi:hypothetical protein
MPTSSGNSQEGLANQSYMATGLGETFVLPQAYDGYYLDKVAFEIVGAAESGMDISLYDITSLCPVGGNGGIPSAYPVTAAQLAPCLVMDYGGFNFPGSSALSIKYFDLDDQLVALKGGDVYYFEFTGPTPTGTNGMFMERGPYQGNGAGLRCAASDSGRYGMWAGYQTPTVTGNQRTFVFGVQMVPEPTTIALLCLGGLVLLRKRS